MGKLILGRSWPYTFHPISKDQGKSMTIDERDEEETAGEESFAELFEKSFVDSGRLEPGQKVEAVVLKIASDWVFLDVGQKGEGVLDKKELLDSEGKPTVKEGDRLPAYFLSSRNGELRFTTRMGGPELGSSQLEEAFRAGIPVEGRIEKEIKGGFEVKVAGARAFCPFSQAGLRRAANPGDLLGQTFPFRITQYGERGRNIVLSHRAILEEERQRQKEALKETLMEGMKVRGTITSVRDFGAFIDIGGLEGLIPVSEVGWGRVEDIRESLSVGQEVEAVVKSLDWEKDRFSFSIRETLADPWSRIAKDYPEGSVHHGRVARLAPFGAFVTLAEGVDGLVHISRLGSGKRISHPREVLKEGQDLQVRIEKVDPESRRLSLVPVDSEVAEEKPAPEDFHKFLDAGKPMGTLGDLLKGKLEKKGKKS
jgi:small subunit ribosomal protein S1